MDEQQRAYFRLWYPQSARPTLVIGDQKFEVSEISEEGARIVLSRPFHRAENESFTGVIQFQDGQTESVAGVVLRSTESEVVANLSQGISLKRMMAEQIQIRKNFPTALRPDDRTRDK